MQTKFLALKKMRQINSLNCLKCTKSSLKLSHACQLKSQGKKCTTNLTPPSIFNSFLKVLSLSGPFPCMVPHCPTLYGAQPCMFRAFLFTSFFEFSPCLALVLSARHCTFRTIPFQFVGFLVPSFILCLYKTAD